MCLYDGGGSSACRSALCCLSNLLYITRFVNASCPCDVNRRRQFTSEEDTCLKLLSQWGLIATRLLCATCSNKNA